MSDIDIVKALRDAANGLRDFKSDQGDYGLCDDAADTITKLRADLAEAERLNKLLQERGGELRSATYAADLASARAKERERCALAAIDATLPTHYQWGRDALEQFVFGKKRAAGAIRALTDEEQ